MKNIGIAINPSKDYKNTILNMVKEKLRTFAILLILKYTIVLI